MGRVFFSIIGLVRAVDFGRSLVDNIGYAIICGIFFRRVYQLGVVYFIEFYALRVLRAFVISINKS
ncbi:hypothetical protein [Bartonella grahamii]|uniref:hypothetical protein n=1 Tax=Bartonella grahamii TaxID=33045 RepID=UPI002E7B5ADD|nr:hypothetical protein [Bartonella grahamii]